MATLQIAAQGDAEPAAAIALQRRIAVEIGRLPGVQAVGIATQIPMSDNSNTTWLRVLGRPWHGEHNETPERQVTAGYFAAIGATLRRGRFFLESEDTSRADVAIVNQAFARAYFPNEEALGRQLSHLSDGPKPITIVGIVDAVRERPLDVDIPPVLYRPFNQSPDNYFALIVRTSQDAGASRGV